MDDLGTAERVYHPDAFPLPENDEGPFSHNVEFLAADEEINFFDLGIVDIKAETESMRQESEVRLRAKSNDLKRFHEKICVRVTAQERKNRLDAQRAQQYLDAKCAKLFSTTTSWQQSENTTPARVSTRPYFQDLKEQKKSMLKECALVHQMEKVLRVDAQIREELLRSTEISRSKEYSTESENESEGDVNNSKPAESPVLLPEQRVALYTTVRRQYMEMNRARVQSSVWRNTSKSSSSKARSPLSNVSVATAVRGSRTRRADKNTNKSNDERAVSSTGVKIVDMTSGCEVRVHRHITTSSTPWRKKMIKAPTTSQADTEHERFLRALQLQLGTPPLCSCAKAGPTSNTSSQPCANNCALYKQPKKREKLLTSVYKQQQLDMTAGNAAAFSPSR